MIINKSINARPLWALYKGGGDMKRLIKYSVKVLPDKMPRLERAQVSTIDPAFERAMSMLKDLPKMKLG